MKRPNGRKHFERHVTIELRVPDAIDLTHTATADGFGEGAMIAERAV